MYRRSIINNSSVFVIAEVGMGHDGSLGLAHAFIDAIAGTGVDAVKFQTHIADSESSSSERFRILFSPQDSNRYSYWKRTEFTKEQWDGLRVHCFQKGLEFMSTPFSLDAVTLLKSIGVARWKIGSAEANYNELVDAILSFRQETYISTGMISLKDVDSLVLRTERFSPKLTLMQCTTMYPTEPETLGLNVIKEFHDRYTCPVGFSDHSGTIYPSLAAVALGVSAIEVHVTLDKRMFGPDVSASITVDALKEMVDGVRFLERARSNPVKKEEIPDAVIASSGAFSRRCFAKRALARGDKVKNGDVVMKKAAEGVADVREIQGQRLTRDLPIGALISLEDFEI